VITEKKFSAAFIDRDGVINKRIADGYVTHPDEFEFLPGVFDAFQSIAQHFQYVCIVTNQQGIGKHLMTVDQLQTVHQLMLDKIIQNEGKIDKIYFCPHRAEDHCNCRKPKTGMFLQALKDFPDIRPDQSVMIGDTLNDMKFGRNAGLKTILISDSIQTDITTLKLSDYQFGSLFDMAKHFL